MNNNYYKTIYLFFILFTTNVYAVQTIEVEENGSYTVKASSSNPNRLAMERGYRLSSVWGDDDSIQLEKDENNGYVLFQIKTKKLFSIMVMDENNSNYTLKIVPVENIPGENIILSPKNDDYFNKFSISKNIPVIFRMKHLLRALALNKSQTGYRIQKTNQEIRFWKETNIKLIKLYKGDDMNGEVYRLTNLTHDDMILTEREFGRLGKNIRLVSIENKILKSGEHTRFYIIRSR
jgi:type-F conjugative transfer system secretin TraK